MSRAMLSQYAFYVGMVELARACKGHVKLVECLSLTRVFDAQSSTRAIRVPKFDL